jgi:hypothetical protein
VTVMFLSMDNFLFPRTLVVRRKLLNQGCFTRLPKPSDGHNR